MPKRTRASLNRDQAQAIAEACYGEVLTYCRRHAPAGYEPADLAQEVFVRFVRSKSYTEQGKPIAYLMRIARSVCIDAHRKPHIEYIELKDDECGRTIDEYAGIENARDDELARALLELPADLREVLELRFDSELSINEVAHVLGMSRFSVRRRVTTALSLLAQQLKEGD